jgi:iron complex outermembrane receptor protein
VPFNFFGGQGPDGNGSITQEMLDFVSFTQRDFSEQTFEDVALNLSGEIMSLPAGELGFAVGFEYRDHEGSFRPDPIAERRETAGIPAGATAGQFDVTEFYGELNVPLIAGVAGAKYLELSLAARTSDYSTSDSEETFKAGLLWQVNDSVSLRSSFSTGFRAPGIGELFGGAAREDFTFTDPCTDFLGNIGSANGGRDAPQPANIISSCQSMGIPAGTAQTNPQLSAVSAGNENLQAETSDSITLGIVVSPDVGWAESFTASLDYYDLQIDDAIQGRDPGDIITACVNTGDPFFCNAVSRGSTGRVNLVDNQLQNIGAINASGFDLLVDYKANPSRSGQFSARLNATFLDEYIEETENPDGSVNVNDLTGVHTDETFERAFPELRATSTFGWQSNNNWSGSLTFRYVDDMQTASGSGLDSVVFTDLQVKYTPSFLDESVTLTAGLNNIFDEDPPVLDTNIVGLSLVSHDLPGTVGYLRFTYRPKN